jgi:hypothetical protein
MKHCLGILLLLGSLLQVTGQSIQGKSDEIRFKGAAVLAEEKRLADEEARLQRQANTSTDTKTLEGLGVSRESIPDYYALIIGVADYKNANQELPNLDQPVIDAQQLKDVLTTRYTFEESKVQFLANPTRSEVIHALEKLSGVVTEKDNVLVFYAGHGVWDKQKKFGYWLAADADTQDRSTWIPNSTLKDYLGTINSKHTLLITDACFGGSIFKTRSAEASAIIMQVHEVYKEKSRRAMTSGNLTTVPDKSVFVTYLLKKLEDNQDVFMSSRLLFSRMFEPISNNTQVVPQFGVIQDVGDEGGDFIFIKK